MTAPAIDELLRLALERAESLGRPPTSTYRLQFHKGFTFKDAAAIVTYLAELGVTHVYASPYFAAVAGSTHGYDVIDHNRINPELGSDQDYADFLATLKTVGLSHILDMVPNHVGVDTNDNIWWNSVLEHGPCSPYAKYFDINWRGSANSPLHDRVLLPILGEPYGRVLEQGQLKLAFDAHKGSFSINYFARRIAISPSSYGLLLKGSEFAKITKDIANLPEQSEERMPSWEAIQKELVAVTERNERARNEIAQSVGIINGKAGDPRSFGRMEELLARQNYRLAFWKIAPQENNYRRFFDINSLAALAMERGEVFHTVHALALRLLAEGKIGGLRIDHPDGLYDPKKYLRRLQESFVLACARQVAGEHPEFRDLDWNIAGKSMIARLRGIDIPSRHRLPLYVVVEKILGFGERFPSDWDCDGTSGYDFLAMVNELFVDPANQASLTRAYQSITGQELKFEELIYQKKRFILQRSLASDWRMLTERLARLARTDRRARDFTFTDLHQVLGEIIACFPVYRSYIDSPDIRNDDLTHLESALHCAIDRNPQWGADMFHFAGDMILQRYPDSFTSRDRARQLRFAGKFQQLTSPTAAKGVEDTAFYIYHRLISLNEVGGDPSRFGIKADELHRYFSDRQRDWPHALSPLSTHDTKRSEDVRARISVLSEFPEEWESRVSRWMKLNAPHRQSVHGLSAPAADEEYLLYQTIVGIFPFAESGDAHEDFIKRIQQFMQKAVREAKQHTSWKTPDEQWEKTLDAFVEKVLDKSSGGEFLSDVATFSRRIAHYGLINSLSQTLLRLAAPGVPDTYQGTELWDFSLVDPDNRRPVDYEYRRRLVADLKSLDGLNRKQRCAKVWEMMEQKEDGRVKLWLTRQALHCRRDHPNLFTTGDYLPLGPIGSLSRHAFAFARRYENTRAVVLIPRFAAALAPAGGIPIGAEIWGKTQLHLPDDFAGRIFENIFTGEEIAPMQADGATQVLAADVLAHFPVALLIDDGKAGRQ